ncbi:ankyrin repeat domain-containing protein [Noviherbaspirillum sp.]|uniref:ankyrin repeat domain-containing protein n=1 Tax=Noviherbaspirillum sp. TaxID=1926288 RepID=UPI002FE317B6
MSAGDWKELYEAALAGDFALVRYHISAGVNPNYQHPEIMCTPLVATLINGHVDIAHYLLEHGADPHLRSEFDGLTPLQAARMHGHMNIVTLLQQHGATESREPFWWRWLPI